MSLILATCSALAQTATPASVYLLRLDRSRSLQSVCVLVNGAGGYHLERHTLRKVRVFEGALDAAEFRNLIHVLSGDPLFKLQQKQIPDLLLKSDDDRVTLDIHRPDSWQQLSFPDSTSREPFRDAMDPLLKWFEALNQKKGRELSEEAGRNNCLPPSKPEFARRKEVRPLPPSPGAPTGPTVALPATYTLLMFDNRVLNYEPHVSCLLISNSGAYHLVRQARNFGKGLTGFVLDGTLSEAERSSLRALLDAPALVSEPDQIEELETIFGRDGYLTRLSIPRAGRVQKIAAWKLYRIVNQVLTRSMEDHGTQLLAPLREWLKVNINEQKAVPTLNPPNPRCSPEG